MTVTLAFDTYAEMSAWIRVHGPLPTRQLVMVGERIIRPRLGIESEHMKETTMTEHSHPYATCAACQEAIRGKNFPEVGLHPKMIEEWPLTVAEVDEAKADEDAQDKAFMDTPILVGPAIEVKSTEWMTVWERLAAAEDRIVELTARIEKLERAL